MFQINDKVIHCREGLSVISNQVEINGKKYFLVYAVGGNGESIYVPLETATSIIRSIMTPTKADEVVDFMKTVKPEFITNTKQRRDAYKRRLGSGNVLDLAYLARQLFLFHYLNEHGTLVKLGPTDIEMLEYASKVLYDEFALSYNIARDEIMEIIESRIES